MIPAPHRALYAAFDRFPSRKGSAVHIDRFARALFEQRGRRAAVRARRRRACPPTSARGTIEIVRYMRAAEHVLERAAGFGERLARAARPAAGPASSRTSATRGAACRSSSTRAARYATVYEVNGLPSIELPFLYPAIPPAVLEQIAELERRCLEQADVVITPSQVTAARLARRRAT